MIIYASSLEDAFSTVMTKYGYTKDQIEIYTLQPPSQKLWGIIKNKGKYYVKLVKPKTRVLPKVEKTVKDGSVEIVNGKVRVENPDEGGRCASLVIKNQNVDVYVNGEKVEGVVIVLEKDVIEFKTKKVPPVTKVHARLSEDKLEAILTVSKIPGKEYYVKDVEGRNSVIVNLDYNEIPAPSATLEECIGELKKINVDPKLIDRKAFNELISSPEGGSRVVAKGRPAIDGQDSKIKYLFINRDCLNPDFKTEKKIDIMSHTVRPTVKVGQVLAVKSLPATEGRDGITVTGEVIEAKPGKDVLLKAGEGTVLLENGMQVVAVADGRPVLKNGAVCVRPELVISGNVDKNTGNIQFDGDVVIKGDVMDSMKVSAGGSVLVCGNVYHANISSEDNIEVLGSVISSKLRAGISVVSYLCILPKMKQLLSFIKKYYCRSYLEGRVGFEKDKLNKIISEIKRVKSLLSDEENDAINEILEKLHSTFVSINPQSSDLKGVYKKVKQYADSINNLYSYKTSVKLKYSQNSFIQSNGSIIVTGKGSYQTNLVARDSIIFKNASSFVRGGTLIAGRYIKVETAGSPAGVTTYFRVFEKDGKIDITCCYSNTILNINDNITVIKDNLCCTSR